MPAAPRRRCARARVPGRAWEWCWSSVGCPLRSFVDALKQSCVSLIATRFNREAGYRTIPLTQRRAHAPPHGSGCQEIIRWLACAGRIVDRHRLTPVEERTIVEARSGVEVSRIRHDAA